MALREEIAPRNRLPRLELHGTQHSREYVLKIENDCDSSVFLRMENGETVLFGIQGIVDGKWKSDGTLLCWDNHAYCEIPPHMSKSFRMIAPWPLKRGSFRVCTFLYCDLDEGNPRSNQWLCLLYPDEPEKTEFVETSF